MYLNEDSDWNDIGITVVNQEEADSVNDILDIFGVISSYRFITDHDLAPAEKVDFKKINEAWYSVAIDREGFNNYSILSAVVETNISAYGYPPSDGTRARYNFDHDEITKFKSQLYDLLLNPYDSKFNKIKKKEVVTLNNVDDFNFKEFDE